MLAYQKNGRKAYIDFIADMYVVMLAEDASPGRYLESHQYPTNEQARAKAREWCGIKNQ